MYKHENENYEDTEEIEDDDINDDECYIGGMGNDSEDCEAENNVFNPSVETETKKTTETETEELKCEMCVSKLKKKDQFALRAKITALHSQLPLEGKGVRVNSVVILQGADISPQHTKTM